jgi:hypothetical protein
MRTFHFTQATATPCRRCGSHEIYEDHDWHLWCNECDAWQGRIVGRAPADNYQPEIPDCSPNGEADIL